MIIGIIGGGQLGMMMAEAAKKYNHTIIGLDPNSECSLSYVADEMVIADYNDHSAFQELANKCEVITYEFENVDLELIEKYKHLIPQKSDALYYSRNRLVEKNFALSLGIPTPRFEKLTQDNIFFPSIIKTTTGGYDGKGQWKLISRSDVDQYENDVKKEMIIEELVEFDYEISVVMTRDQYGKVDHLPVPVNYHRNGILHISEVTNDLDYLIEEQAVSYTKRIIEKLDYVGTLAVEFFVKGSKVIFNEFAPRTHNSGHYSIEGASVSQFENHILAITGSDILGVNLIKPTIMINILGQDYAYIETYSGNKCYLHMYHKKEQKTNRKMGHITILKDTKEEITSIREALLKESL